MVDLSLKNLGDVLCAHCPAACCRYLALPIDAPHRKRDYDDIRWYLMHENISVFVEEGDWYVQFQTRCKNLGEDHLCMVYETRPDICSEYEADGCDYAPGDYGYDHLFTHSKQIEELYEKRTGKKLGAPSARPKPRKTRKKKKKSA